ncbi:MAG TPA: Rieske (2Fe-2S) protein [Candidatus Nitrosotalea sp.]|nr:Rieske (2Fe-2S) protein [Candidatus Nitrosotalea sp.]
MTQARRVASLDEVPAGRPKLVELDGTRIVLARVGDSVYAVGDVCTHRGGPLGEGKLNGNRLVCPWHGWMYDVRTGQCLFPGRGAGVPVYPVRTDAGEIFVELP